MTKAKDMTSAELADKLTRIAVDGYPAFRMEYSLLHKAAAHLRATDWQPIESAPDSKEAQRILVFGGRYVEPTMVWQTAGSGDTKYNREMLRDYQHTGNPDHYPLRHRRGYADQC